MTYVKFILKKVFPIFFGALFFFSFIIVLIDLLMNIWNYLTVGAAFLQIMKVELFYLPKAISYSIPMSVLFSTSYALSDFYSKNELTSIFASGVSLFRFTLPVLVIALFLSVGFIFFEDKVVVPTYAKKNDLQDALLNKSASKNNNMIVIRGDNGKRIYRVTFYDDSQKRLHGIYIVQRDEKGSLDYIVTADSALWINDKWDVFGTRVYKIEDEKLVQVTKNLKSYSFIEEGPDIFRSNVISIESVSIKDARTYIKHLKRVGLPYNEELSEYYKKFSFPFVIFIVAFLSIGLSGKTRKNVLLMSLVFSLGATVAFYVLQMVTMLLAQFGYISPFMGAWFPVIVFIIISLVLLYYART